MGKLLERTLIYHARCPYKSEKLDHILRRKRALHSCAKTPRPPYPSHPAIALIPDSELQICDTKLSVN